MRYRYIGFKSDGEGQKEVKGVVEASERKEAILRAKSEGGVEVLRKIEAESKVYELLGPIITKLNSIEIGKSKKSKATSSEVDDPMLPPEMRMLKKQRKLRDVFKERQKAIKERDKEKEMFENDEEKIKKKIIVRKRKTDIDAGSVKINWAQLLSTEGEHEKIKVKPDQVLLFTKQLGAAIDSGVDTATALRNYQGVITKKNKKMRKVAYGMYTAISQGQSLGSAIARFPRTFGKLYAALISAGEESGELVPAIQSAEKYITGQIKIRRKIKSAMIYPMIVLIVVLLMLLLGSIFFIPKFIDMFEGFGLELPTLTRVVFAIADVIPQIFLGVGLLSGLHYAVKNVSPMYAILIKVAKDKIVLKIPNFGNYVRNNGMYFFCSTLGTMQKSGISLPDSLDITADVMTNEYIRSDIKNVKDLVATGVSLADAIQEQERFKDGFIAPAVSSGEQSGYLPDSLLQTAKYYDDLIESQVQQMDAMFQPIVILILAAIVVPVMFAIFIPILSLSSGSFM